MNRPIRSSDPSGHPFRRAVTLGAVERSAPRRDDGDLKLFALSFSAFFVCFYVFII